MQRERGTFLSILIAVNAIAIALATLALVFIPGVSDALGSFPAWFNLFLIVFLAARLIALFLIWRLERIGVYSFFLLECLEVGMGLFVFTSVFTFGLRLMAAPAFLILIGIWYLALRPRWSMFS